VVFPHTDQLQAIALSTKYNLLETLLWLIWTVFKKLVHVIYQTRKRFFRMTIDGVENIGRRSEWVSFLGYRKQANVDISIPAMFKREQLITKMLFT